MKYTENLRKQLPELIRDFSVKTVFDAPCGDFNWMSSIIRQLNVQYTGGDIVRPLIDNHNIKYRNNKTKFIQINLIKDEFPRADLMICRDCLFHLSYNDIRGVLQNYVESGIPLLLTTTHINESGFENRDIKTGDVRMIDLFSSPFNLSPEPLARIDDWVQPYPMRQMCLWNRNQIIECLEQLQRNSN